MEPTRRWGSSAGVTELHIVIATRNPGKAREFREMLASDKVLWTDLSDHPQVGEIEETGRTFRANACLKASGYARQTGHWALADDSGLEIDALGGAPEWPVPAGRCSREPGVAMRITMRWC